MTTSGHNVGLEEEKPMNDTPRTDVAWKTLPSVYDFIVEMKRIERELNAANQRINRLEEAGDELLAALQDDWSEYIEWINESTDAVGKWKRAKEAKP